MAPIPKQMKAIQVTEFNKPYCLMTVSVLSDLWPYDLLVKVAVASYCHADSMVASGIFGTEISSTASHIESGTVILIGSNVSDFALGDRVMCGLPLHRCGACAMTAWDLKRVLGSTVLAWTAISECRLTAALLSMSRSIPDTRHYCHMGLVSYLRHHWLVRAERYGGVFRL
ncbi:chaperonin 10-like protein [Truncatella angustata]|uniref:Chaperonin 10-like protein n=1 Tax=Truncatella angustata TaxID=152316 RepID=A0A9P8ZVZ6_9PEZI|nr:chaperonin 10-like protein [Truncatella angustata]KAH6652516.1 chaperonin 10-like protein [Truncatella angustata]